MDAATRRADEAHSRTPLSTVLLTGFPGFLGSELLPRVLARQPGDRALCIVQPRYAPLAKERASAIVRRQPTLHDRIEIVEGDITSPGLGVAPGVLGDVTEIHHLAAIYDLSVRRDAAMSVNVTGTRNVLALAASCQQLRRLHYVSTCYVSGRYPGVFTESMLEEGQRFNNFYEESKHLAEVEVRRAMSQGLPATIYRPSVVVGDSTSGATQKYDGPYYVLQWLLRQPPVAVMPVVGRPTRVQFNMVPRDFVVDAMTHLSGRDDSIGRTYAIADPSPLTVHDLLSLFARATGRTMLRLPLPLALAKLSIAHLPGVYPLLRIPASAVDYFDHPTRYDTAGASSALAPAGISCPRVADYVNALVTFMQAHPHVAAEGMR